jgi:hypothetical protein
LNFPGLVSSSLTWKDELKSLPIPSDHDIIHLDGSDFSGCSPAGTR